MHFVFFSSDSFNPTIWFCFPDLSVFWVVLAGCDAKRLLWKLGVCLQQSNGLGSLTVWVWCVCVCFILLLIALRLTCAIPASMSTSQKKTQANWVEYETETAVHVLKINHFSNKIWHWNIIAASMHVEIVSVRLCYFQFNIYSPI